MKRRTMTLLMVPLMVSLSVGNVSARTDHDGFIAGACAVGAALLGAAGAVALVDWCCSETDDQLIARVSNEYHVITANYQQTMDYFGPRAGVGIHAPHRPASYIPESVLLEFAGFLWNGNVSPQDYMSGVFAARDKLQSCTKDLRKRIHNLENKYTSYEEQKRLVTMRNLAQRVDQLFADIALLAQCLECHKTYLALCNTIGKTHTRYAQEINIVTSERYSLVTELKQYVVSHDGGRYAFKNFVREIEADIAQVNSRVYALARSYPSAQNDAILLVNRLNYIKNLIVSDPRYQQELYEWEQARLERQRMQMLEEQARLERERIRVLEQQNRILAEHNRLERQKMYVQPAYVEEVTVTVNF
jgi:hypothetical protein